MYLATTGIEIGHIKNQPGAKEVIIDITKDKKEEVINKIKKLTDKDFIKIETKKDDNCLFYANLKSNKEKEIKHMELRQIADDYIEQIDYENENTIFTEKNCKAKKEYVDKIRKNGEYGNDIVLEAISKMTNYIIGIYKSDSRYKENSWTLIEPFSNNYKVIILFHLF